jgi:flagellar hook-basal body complex protein FliE
MINTVNASQAVNAYNNTSNLQSSRSASLTENPALGGAEATAFKPDFEQLITEALDKARDAGYDGESMSAKSLANKAEYHELVTAVNNADLTMRTVVAVRDKMIAAYQDIIKMPM